MLLILGTIYFFIYDESLVACTEDARLCSDGSSVARIPPSCEFELCPEDLVGEGFCVELGCSVETKFVGSINSDKFYPCDCHYANSINSENIICFSSGNEAIEAGYVLSEC